MQYSLHNYAHGWSNPVRKHLRYGPPRPMPRRTPHMRRPVLLVLLATLIVGAGGTVALQRATHHEHLKPVVFARPIYRVPTTIDATGGSNVNVALENFVRRVPDGAIIVFPTAGRYRIEGPIEIDDRNDLTFAGGGSTFFATTKGDRNRSQWVIRGGSNLAFRNMHVIGANPHGGASDAAYVETLEAQHGFILEGTSHFDMETVSITDTYGDFVYITRGLTSHAWSDDIHIHDNAFRRNGRQGISMVAARNVFIERNYITETRRAVFDIEGLTASQGAINIQILNNKIGPGRLYLLGGGRALGTVDRILIKGNRLHNHLLNTFQSPPAGSTRTNISIIDNTSDWPSYGDPTLRFNNTQNLIVTGNTQPSRTYPLLCQSCTNVTNSGNSFPRV